MPACVGRGVAMPFAPTVWVIFVAVVVDVNVIVDVSRGLDVVRVRVVDVIVEVAVDVAVIEADV
jgi:hypothetical protein